MNQLTNFEVDSDVLATIQSVKKKHRKHPSGTIQTLVTFANIVVTLLLQI